jgi:hypothetical protein
MYTLFQRALCQAAPESTLHIYLYLINTLLLINFWVYTCAFYVDLEIYLCINVNTYLYINIYIHINIVTESTLWSRPQIYILYLNVNDYISEYTHTYLYEYLRKLIHIYIKMSINTNINIYIYIIQKALCGAAPETSCVYVYM